MTPIISLNKLKKNYQSFQLNLEELHIRPGVVTGLIGPNGAGKTTLIKCLLNLVRYDAESLTLFGMDNHTQGREIRARLGFMFDDKSFFEELTVSTAESLVSRFYSRWDRNAFNRIIETFAISRQAQIKQLSKGMRASFYAALALSHQADLVILDEPTSGLDPNSKEKMLDILLGYVKESGRGVFFSTHSTTDLDKIAHDVVHIEQGKLRFCGTKIKLLEDYSVFADHDGALRHIEQQQIPHAIARGLGNNRIIIHTEHLHLLPQNSTLTHLVANIEDVMLYASKGEKSHV